MDQERSFRSAGREDWHESELHMDRQHRWLMRGLWAIVIIIGLGLVWSVWDGAKAQGMPVCKPEADLRNELASQYHEAPIGFGIVNEQAAIMVYASPGGETFTIAFVGADGTACMIAAGTDLNLGKLPGSGRES